MRAIRTLVVGVGIIALAGLTAACDELTTSSSKGCYGPPVYVTGEAPDGLGQGLTLGMSADQGVPTTYEWEASDPRLSGTLDRIEGGFAAVDHAEAHAWVLEAEDGQWVGPATILDVSDPDGGSVATVLLSGEGGYAGLAAYLVVVSGGDGDEPAKFSGMLFPGLMPSPSTAPVE